MIMSFIGYREDTVSQSAEEMREEAYARWRAQAAAQSEIRRQAGQVAIWLQRAPDDTATFTRGHQAELRELLGPILRDKELGIDAPFMMLDSVDAVSGYTGQVIVSLAQIASPVLTAALVAWLKGRPSRKVRVEFHPGGEVKTVEAQTEEQVLSLVKALDQEPRAKPPKAKKK
jgi:hypothetical protein